MSYSRLTLKQELLSTIKNTAVNLGINPEYPINDQMISSGVISQISDLTEKLEKLNPFPKPLQFTANLLDGNWQLHYSTAREIRFLNKLPFGFKVKQVYQLIDVVSASFFNLAFVEHESKLLEGYVKVTASFTAKIEEGEILPDSIINVNFEKRFIAIQKIAGLETPFFDPLQQFDARNPQGRIPSLKITYIDENMRIGRGGDGSLFILSKSN
ncbi:MAG: fimbrial protein [Cyanobacterium sp. T60_A2020_053]|nr:fimbrial protein [Cyanobacterium sp. T60_A2020_053]